MHTRRSSLGLIFATGGSISLLPSLLSAEEKKPVKPYGIALCGLGDYSEAQLAPALQETKYCKLTGLITGSPNKIPKWQKKYGIQKSNIYSYDQMAELGDNNAIDIVYIVTPHGLHFKHTMAALNAGKHVIVEKPMAGTADECRQMIDLAKEKNLNIEVGYRLHWDPYHLAARDAARNGKIGQITEIISGLAYYDPTPKPTAWQIDKELSIAGALYSVGVYPIQAALYLLRENPTRVTATSFAGDPNYYKEVPLGYDFTLDFPSGAKAVCRASSGHRLNYAEAKGTKGSLRIDSAYSYQGVQLTINGKKITFPKNNQQAAQMDAQAIAIANKRPSLSPGTMGLRDVIILEAIMKSATTGQPVDLPKDLGFPSHT